MAAETKNEFDDEFDANPRKHYGRWQDFETPETGWDKAHMDWILRGAYNKFVVVNENETLATILGSCSAGQSSRFSR